jgi:Flp pilus assembly pilin Flp
VGFLRDENAAGLVEYALILGVVAISVIVAMVFLRTQLINVFSMIGNHTDPACVGQQQQGQCP